MKRDHKHANKHLTRIVRLPGSAATSLPFLWADPSHSENANSIARRGEPRSRVGQQDCVRPCVKNFFKPEEFQTQCDTPKIHQQRHPSLKNKGTWISSHRLESRHPLEEPNLRWNPVHEGERSSGAGVVKRSARDVLITSLALCA